MMSESDRPRVETVGEALAWARERLASLPHTEPLDAPLLLAYLLRVDRATLIAHPERALTPDQVTRYGVLVERRASGEPLAYIVGERAFFDRVLSVTPDVLIPRPETEHLIEQALNWARARLRECPAESLRIADVGAGSGAIAVTLAANLPGVEVWAIDVSAAALDVARQNAARSGVGGRVRLVRGDLLVPLIDIGAQVDLIAANLPYIPTAEVDRLPVAQHEPRLALDGGPDGLVLIARLLEQAPRVLAAGGLILLEIGADQGAAVREAALQVFPGAAVSVSHDYAGRARVVRIEPAAVGEQG